MKPLSRLQIARAPSVHTSMRALCVATVVLVTLGGFNESGQPSVKGVDNSSLTGEP